MPWLCLRGRCPYRTLLALEYLLKKYGQLATLGVYNRVSSLHFYSGYSSLFLLQPSHLNRSVETPTLESGCTYHGSKNLTVPFRQASVHPATVDVVKYTPSLSINLYLALMVIINSDKAKLF